MKCIYLLITTSILILFIGSCSERSNKTGVEACFRHCGKPLYGDVFKDVVLNNAYFDYDQGLCCAEYVDKPILIFFNAWAGVNCRSMEENVLSDTLVLKYINDHFVFLNLYVDDRTLLEEQKEVFFRKRNRVLKTVGDKNVYLQILGMFGGSQPNFRMIDSQGNKIDWHIGYTPNIEDFFMKLKEGVAQFNKHKVTKD